MNDGNGQDVCVEPELFDCRPWGSCEWVEFDSAVRTGLASAPWVTCIHIEPLAQVKCVPGASGVIPPNAYAARVFFRGMMQAGPKSGAIMIFDRPFWAETPDGIVEQVKGAFEQFGAALKQEASKKEEAAKRRIEVPGMNAPANLRFRDGR